MRIDGHFTLLIYPFRHAITDDAADMGLRALDKRWRHWWTRLSAESLERALDDTYFFLPHIRKQLLFPEVLLLPNDSAAQAEEATRLARVSASALAGLLAEQGFRQSSVLRLTCDPGVREALHPLHLDDGTEAPAEPSTRFPVHVDWIDLILFPQHVGFLVLKVRLDEPAPTADRLNDFLYFLRFVHRPTVGWRLPAWTRAEPPLRFEARDLVDFLLQGVAVETDRPGDSFEEFLGRATSRGGARGYSLTEQGQVYGQIFRQYSYGCVSDPSPDATSEAVERSGAPELFASPVQRALYELATCTRTADPDSTPHPRGLARTLEQGYIALWANWQAMALHDNVVFLGARGSVFTRQTLPHNVEADYFHPSLSSRCSGGSWRRRSERPSWSKSSSASTPPRSATGSSRSPRRRSTGASASGGCPSQTSRPSRTGSSRC